VWPSYSQNHKSPSGPLTTPKGLFSFAFKATPSIVPGSPVPAIVVMVPCVKRKDDIPRMLNPNHIITA
jgi:hypothetical protein